jgi:hypothetical protein
MASEFWEKYKDPRWQRLRLEVMEDALFACQQCDSTLKTLNVHHKFYRKGANPWEYDLSELICLCQDCHQYIHSLKGRLDIALSRGDSYELEFVVGYAEGIYYFFEGPVVDAKINVSSYEMACGIAAAFNILDPNKVICMCLDDGEVSVVDLHNLVAQEQMK